MKAFYSDMRSPTGGPPWTPPADPPPRCAGCDEILIADKIEVGWCGCGVFETAMKKASRAKAA